MNIFSLPHFAELEIPDNANVFYAVNRSDEAMHFILRRKADQVSRTIWQIYQHSIQSRFSIHLNQEYQC